MLAHNSTGRMYTVNSSAGRFYLKNAPVSPTFLLFSLLPNWGREAGTCFPHLSLSELQPWCINTFD